MAWAIWIFGSAFWSIFALAEAVRYFHSFTNGLGIVPPVRRGVRPDRSSSSSVSSSQVIRYRGQLLGSPQGSRRQGSAVSPGRPVLSAPGDFVVDLVADPSADAGPEGRHAPHRPPWAANAPNVSPAPGRLGAPGRTPPAPPG